MAIVPAYTQADLDADIVGITDAVETVIDHVARIKDNWAQVQSLHPGVTAVEYIRDHVPYLARNTAAAVALVEAGATSVSDAARLTGQRRATVSEAATKNRTVTVQMQPETKPTTLATGKAAPGPAVGTTKKVEVKKKESLPNNALPYNVPAIAGLPSLPAVQPPSQLVDEAIRLLRQVAALDANAVSAAQTAEQHAKLKRAAERAGKVCERLARPLIIFP
jgi:hypothetical protein